MYCRKCGKWIDYEADICVDCQQNEELFKVENEETAQQAEQNKQYGYFMNGSTQQPYGQPTYGQPAYSQPMYGQPVQPQDKGSRMAGFGLALTGTIISFFAFIFSCVFTALAATGIGAALVFFVLATGLTVFTLISGIKSLNTSKACVRAGKVKPIPAFIMGIVNIVMAGLSFLYIFIGLMALSVML